MIDELGQIPYLFYSYFESGVFILIMSLMVLAFIQYTKTKSRIQRFIFFFLLFYAFSVAFSAITKHWKYVEINPDLGLVFFENFADSYWAQLIYFARLKYVSIISANISFINLYYEIYSKPRSKLTQYTENFSSIIISLHFVPIFSSIMKIMLMGCVLLHSMLVYIPVLVQSRQMLRRTSHATHKVIRVTFFLSLLLVLLVFIAVMDALVYSVLGMDFPLFYYLGWMDVVFAMIFATRNFIFSDWSVVKHEINLTAENHTENSSKVLFIECPICKRAKYISILEKILLKTLKSPSGMSSMLIPSQEICEHTFIVHFDENFKVRNTQQVDFIA
ncbi:MAG: hypothetical protein ACTSYI_04325 [Promethearchaeota archaeon]